MLIRDNKNGIIYGTPRAIKKLARKMKKPERWIRRRSDGYYELRMPRTRGGSHGAKDGFRVSPK